MLDLHIHSALSHDAEPTIREYCERARETGMMELGFAEHLDLSPTDPHCGKHDYQKYRAEIAEARREFPELKIRMGVEATFLPSDKKVFMEYLDGKEYDYVLGAVHLLENVAANISEEEPCREYFSRKDAEQCYAEFFELTLELVKSGIFDALAHLDIINRFAVNYAPNWEWRPYYGMLRRIFEGMIKRQMALEINTSGWRQAPGRPFPETELVRLYRELGGKMVCIGSDAHRLEHLGCGCGRALELARELGFSQVVTFERRNMIWITIGEERLKILS